MLDALGNTKVTEKGYFQVYHLVDILIKQLEVAEDKTS